MKFMKIKKSKLALNISDWFKNNTDLGDISFGEILDKFCEIGMSRETVKKVLEDLTKEEIRIVESTLYYAIHFTIDNNDTKFRLDAKRRGNKFHGNRKEMKGKRKGGKNIKRKKEANIKGIFCCKECGNSFIENIKDINVIGIRHKVCKKCKKRGKMIVDFVVKGKKMRKEMADSLISGIKKESFL